MINCIQTLKQHLMINCTPKKIPFILILILLFEKQIIECNSVKHINEDSQTSLTNIKSVDQNLLSIFKKSTDCVIYYI